MRKGLPPLAYHRVSSMSFALGKQQTEPFQWLLPRSQRARYEPRFSDPRGQFSFYQAHGGYGNSYGMHTVPPPGEQITFHYMRVEMLILKPTTRTTLLHRPTNRPQVLRRSIPCSPSTLNPRLGRLRIHFTGTQGLQIQPRHWVPGTLFGNRRGGVKVKQRFNLGRIDTHLKHNKGRSTLGVG